MKKQTAIFFYLLGVYAVMQFIWWGYHLIELSSEVNSNDTQTKRLIMIIGEGLVFFIILILGLWKIRHSFQKEIKLSKRQNNFLLSVTHELKTPLTSNKLYIQTLLKRKGLERQQQEEMLNFAIKENKRLEDMIDNILTATRIDNHRLQLNKVECNLSETISNNVQKWSASRIPVSTSIEENIHIHADLFIIETTLNNLLDNALKYAGKEAQIEVYLKKEKNLITWGVKDNGKGIDPENAKDIFKKFVRVGNEETRTEKGTGLGLYIVKNLIKFHGDTITYEMNKPNGAHFKITIHEKQ